MEFPMVVERTAGKWRCGSGVEAAPNCPRCSSSNTKFCYYNNYSLSQPRYFCKGCRRYWTKGGTLRNVPVGGGCRKSRRARAARHGGGANSSSPMLKQSESGGAGGGTDIDLAAVFAKYVSQNIGENEESCSPGGSSGSSDQIQAEIDGQYLDDVTMFQYQVPPDLINGGDDPDQLLQANPEINGQDFVFQESNGYDLQDGFLGDELGLLLSDEVINLPDFEWQQRATMQVQDLGNFTVPDANLSSDQNWGLFDLFAYENFSRP